MYLFVYFLLADGLVPWPLWLTSLAVITLWMTVWRKSFSPATLGEKDEKEMFSHLWRMASSNACLQYAHIRQTDCREEEMAKEEEEHGKRTTKSWLLRGEWMRQRQTHQSVIRIPWQTQNSLLALKEAERVMRKTHRGKIIILKMVPSQHLFHQCSTGNYLSALKAFKGVKVTKGWNLQTDPRFTFPISFSEKGE